MKNRKAIQKKKARSEKDKAFHAQKIHEERMKNDEDYADEWEEEQNKIADMNYQHWLVESKTRYDLGL